MAGAMRKMGVYLGLVEDDDRREVADYEDYDEYAEAEVVPVRRVAAGRGWEDAEPLCGGKVSETTARAGRDD